MFDQSRAALLRLQFWDPVSSAEQPLDVFMSDSQHNVASIKGTNAPVKGEETASWCKQSSF